MSKISRGGFAPIIIVIIIVVISAVGGAGFWFYFSQLSVEEPVQGVQPPAEEQPPAKLNASDRERMKKYCLEELVKLPETPFVYDLKKGPDFTGPSIWLKKFVPEDKWWNDQMVVCTLAYEFHKNTEAAYSSVGVVYEFDIKKINAFYEQIDRRVTDAMTPGWEKISPFPRKETGTPGYSYDGLPAVFRRENPKTGTVEFAEIYTAVDLYVKFTAYIK